jgi:putative addiction module CopG family antidote
VFWSYTVEGFIRGYEGVLMTVVLSPETQQLVEQKLRSGAYRSADEVVHAALEALDLVSAGELDEATLDALDRAEDQIDRGEEHDWKDVRQQVRDMFTKG